MGSGRDKRKKAKGKVPGHGEEKTARKTELNQTKAERRAAKQLEVGRKTHKGCKMPHVSAFFYTLVPDSCCPTSSCIMQGGEDDLDALLKQFEIQDRKAKEIVIVSNADSPTARLFASFTPVPGPVRKYILW